MPAPAACARCRAARFAGSDRCLRTQQRSSRQALRGDRAPGQQAPSLATAGQPTPVIPLRRSTGRSLRCPKVLRRRPGAPPLALTRSNAHHRGHRLLGALAEVLASAGSDRCLRNQRRSARWRPTRCGWQRPLPAHAAPRSSAGRSRSQIRQRDHRPLSALDDPPDSAACKSPPARLAQRPAGVRCSDRCLRTQQRSARWQRPLQRRQRRSSRREPGHSGPRQVVRLRLVTPALVPPTPLKVSWCGPGGPGGPLRGVLGMTLPPVPEGNAEAELPEPGPPPGQDRLRPLALRLYELAAAASDPLPQGASCRSAMPLGSAWWPSVPVP
jgi:hypothetical protein